MSEFIRVTFSGLGQVERELLCYKLSVDNVDSIEERDENVIAYFKKEVWFGVNTQYSKFQFVEEKVKNENWNAIWESSFKPVTISNYCYVRAPFHSKNEDENLIDIVLEPKMAFGTAHHETTYMMMSQMQCIDFNGKLVFDYGCGTAILSVLAEKLGAQNIFAIDIEENAIENAAYNANINDCLNIQVRMGTLKDVQPQKFDIILANINRGVLLESATELSRFLSQGGVLLVSGILQTDEEMVVDAYKATGFKHLSTIERGDWKCVKFTR